MSPSVTEGLSFCNYIWCYHVVKPSLCIVIGKMKTAIFLHGFCENGSMWDRVKNFLSITGHQVFAPDLPGFGSNNNPVDSIGQMADFVYQFIQTNHIQNPVIFGHSMGGYIALDFVSRYPKLASGIGLIHSHAAADSADKIANRQKLIAFIQQHGPKAFLKQFAQQLLNPKKHNTGLEQQAFDLVSKTQSEGIIAASQAMIDRKDFTAELKNIDLPMLWLVGEEDSFIDFDQVIEQACSCQRSMLEIMPEVGHLGMYENPELTHEIILKYLEWVE